MKKEYSKYVADIVHCLRKAEGPLSKRQIARELEIDIDLTPGQNIEHDLLIGAIDLLLEREVIYCAVYLGNPPGQNNRLLGEGSVGYYHWTKDEELIEKKIVSMVYFPQSKYRNLEPLYEFFDSNEFDLRRKKSR